MTSRSEVTTSTIHPSHHHRYSTIISFPTGALPTILWQHPTADRSWPADVYTIVQRRTDSYVRRARMEGIILTENTAIRAFRQFRYTPSERRIPIPAPIRCHRRGDRSIRPLELSASESRISVQSQSRRGEFVSSDGLHLMPRDPMRYHTNSMNNKFFVDPR